MRNGRRSTHLVEPVAVVQSLPRASRLMRWCVHLTHLLTCVLACLLACLCACCGHRDLCGDHLLASSPVHRTAPPLLCVGDQLATKDGPFPRKSDIDRQRLKDFFIAGTRFVPHRSPESDSRCISRLSWSLQRPAFVLCVCCTPVLGAASLIC
jgi:hypothetical protein